MFKRSRHIEITVREDQVEEAVLHYEKLLGTIEASRSADGVELVGDNFTLWISTRTEPGVLQEFSIESLDAARAAVEASGANVIGESDSGLYVEDPYGLNFHFSVEK